MILVWILAILMVAAVLVWTAGRLGAAWPRWLSLAALGVDLVMVLVLWAEHGFTGGEAGQWLTEFRRAWVPEWGIHFSLAMDGLSLLLIALSLVLGMLAVGASWNSVTERVGFFHFNLLVLLAAIIGVFLAVDLFLFYVFWEVMLVPLYFLVAVWGHENRVYAAVKFFIFTQAGGLFMLAAILGLYFYHYGATDVYTFEYSELLGTVLSDTVAWWLMLGFFAAFAVKLPAFPVHTWLPDAHTEAPTAGSVILAGLVLKVGAYGLIRFVVPLFPEASFDFAVWAMLLGVVSILYGAITAFGQTDLKRLVAYTSVSHMGFVLVGVFAWNELALQGAVVVMLAHGLSTSALFILVGDLYERLHTRDMYAMGGFWKAMPRMGGFGMVFAMASLGLPGLGNFVGEILVLLGAFQANVPLAILATLGFIVSTAYSLLIVQRVFHGEQTVTASEKLPDLSLRETGIMAVLTVLLVWLGVYPQTFLETGRPSIEKLQEDTAGTPGSGSQIVETESNIQSVRGMELTTKAQRTRR